MATIAAREDHLKCSICFEFFNKPRTLPCLHTFCETCLQNFISSRHSGGKFDCPVCRHSVTPPMPGKSPTEWAMMFPINFSFQSMIELEVSENERIAKRGNPCSCGGKRELEVYCEDHDVMSCSTCGTVNHRRCDNVVSLHEMAENIKRSGVLEINKQGLQDLRQRYMSTLKDLQQNVDDLATQKKRIINEIAAMKLRLIHAAEELEKECKADVEQFFLEEQSRILEKQIQSRRQLLEIGKILSQLQDASKSENDSLLVTTCKDTSTAMEEFGRYLNESHSSFLKIELEKDSGIEEAHSLLKSFGSVKLVHKNRIEDTKQNEEGMTGRRGKRFANILKCDPASPLSRVKQQAVKINHFFVSLPCSESGAFVTGAACLNNNDIIVCEDSAFVKVFRPDGAKIGRVKLNYPRDVTVVSDDEVAVTLQYDEKIQFLLTKPKLSMSRCITTSKPYTAISYHKGEFLVTCNSSPNLFEIRILGTEGEVKRIITSDGSGGTFSSLYFAAFSNKGSLLVCDQKRGVIGMDVDGRVLFEYKDITRPCGIAVNKYDNVYVCGTDSNDVHYLDSTGKRIQILLSTKDDDKLMNPYALCCSHDSAFLYVFPSVGSSRICLQYKLKLMKLDGQPE